MRAFRGLWLWLGVLFLTLFAFLAAVAIAYFIKQPGYSLFGNGWMITAWLAFLAAFGCLFGAAKGWALLPGMKPGFPNIKVEILSVGSTGTERESESGLDVPAFLRSYNVRFSSLEPERTVTLSVLLYVKLVAGSWGRAGEALCPPPSWALSPALGLRPMAMPFVLSPGGAASGQLVFEIPRFYLGKLAEPLDGRLEIADQASGKCMTIPAELGQYDRSAMRASRGGAEVLGPDFEAEALGALEPVAEQRRDAEQPQA